MKLKKIVTVLSLVGGLAVVSLSWAAGTATPSMSKAPVVAAKPMSPVHLLSQKAWHQMVQVQRDVKAGKLTKAQAEALKGQVKSARQQELAFLKQNGNHQLTNGQFTQVDGQLDTISKSIPVN
jgi:hypothetical protein